MRDIATYYYVVTFLYDKIGMEKVFVGFRQLGPDTIVGAKYIKRNEGSFEKEESRLA